MHNRFTLAFQSEAVLFTLQVMQEGILFLYFYKNLLTEIHHDYVDFLPASLV